MAEMTTAATQADRSAAIARTPWTLWTGLAIILACEALLFYDVVQRDWLVVGRDVLPGNLPEPAGLTGEVARWVAANMTGLCWIAYLLLFDGLLTWLARHRGERGITAIRARPNRFLVAWLTSIPVWCFFDTVNFYWIDAWRYWGLPAEFWRRAAGYFVAFAAISPGMFLAAQLYQHLGMRRLRTAGPSPRLAWTLVLGIPAAIAASVLALLATSSDAAGFWLSAAVLLLPGGLLALSRNLALTSLGIGASLVAWTFLARDPIANLTLWVGLIYLLDPIARRAGLPSILRDWELGRFGRTLALFAGGATCGLLWEFWNYWAIAKWTYHLPFLGGAERISYFEMPLPGFLGFLPFAVECWVMLNVIIAMFEKLGVPMAEPLPDEHGVM